MQYTVRSDSPVSISLCESDIEKSVLQNLYLLINTRQGSIPMYREFGLPQKFKDRPINVLETLLAAEVTEGIKKFEPRATLLNLSYELTDVGTAAIVLEVDV